MNFFGFGQWKRNRSRLSLSLFLLILILILFWNPWHEIHIWLWGFYITTPSFYRLQPMVRTHAQLNRLQSRDGPYVYTWMAAGGSAAVHVPDWWSSGSRGEGSGWSNVAGHLNRTLLPSTSGRVLSSGERRREPQDALGNERPPSQLLVLVKTKEENCLPFNPAL